MADQHRGTCFCGAVEVSASGEPIDMGYCHCGSCRAYSGAPFVAFTIWPEDRVEVTGHVGSYDKAGTSERVFCSRCGGHLLLRHPHLGLTDIRAGILPSVTFTPRSHLNYAARVMPVRDGLPKFSDMPVEIGGSGELIVE
ncbi:GFA family protein [Altererythrobacter soli]|uniref:GFA family protein n=1 Tax=Croceibacterium soli TaxID=1739690 RepID=A0A6I4URW2_9SPHN|nr:GFA family protein [Croceibacterium soli]MXP41642.1 GFA family protein [Croceibacterium soli]